MAKEIWDALETGFGKAGGAQTYLQLVNMITIKMTNTDSLLTQIQEFQENYTRNLANSHSTFSEDLITFTFCSTLPLSYEETAHQYLDNINDITKYKLLDIFTQVLQEENCRKANSIAGGSSLNKFSKVKNLKQKCVKCGKMNHSTQNHWEKGKHPQKGKGKYVPKASTSSWSGNKKSAYTGKGKEKAKDSLNVLSIVEIPEVNTFSNKSIDSSCYITGEKVEWLLDVEMEYCEMLFRLETEHSNKELYWIIAQSRPVQMISY